MNPHDLSRTLGIMAKYWEKGRVKTRLANSIATKARFPIASSSELNQKAIDFSRFRLPEDAPEIAAMIHRLFLRGLLDHLRHCGDVRELVASPPHRLDDFPAIFDNDSPLDSPLESRGDGLHQDWTITEQGEGDLGERMHRWFARHLLGPYRPTRTRTCVLIGADCPLLSHHEIDAAWTALQHHDLVLGPAFDGGYYLIGLRYDAHASDQCSPAEFQGNLTPVHLASLFGGIRWSTASVFRDTLAVADHAGLKVATLAIRRDVDQAEDLEMLIRTLRDTGQENHPILKMLGGMQFC